MSYVSTKAQLAFDLFDFAPLPSFVIHAKNFAILRASASASALYQYTNEEFLGLTFTDLCDKEGRLCFANLLSKGKPFRERFQHVKKDGSVCRVDVVAQLVAYEIDHCYYISIIDQTDLWSDMEHYRSYIDQSSEAIWRYEFREPVAVSHTPEFIIEHIRQHAYLAACNDQFAKMYGCDTVDELIGTPLQLIFDLDVEENFQFLKTFIKNGFRWMDAERTHIDKNGKCYYFISNLIGTLKDGYLTGGWGNQRDITEKKKIGIALKESENRFKEVADSAPVIIWMSGTDNVTEYVNQRWIDYTGVDITDMDENGWSMMIHPDDREQAVKRFFENAANREAVTSIYRFKNRCGDYRWVIDKGTPRILKDGTYLGYIGSIIDIHDQKLQQEQLRYQSTLFDNLSDIIVTTDLQFVVRSWNKIAEKYYGVEEKNAIGKKISELLTFNYSETTQQEALEKLINHGKWAGEVVFDAPCGEQKTFLQTVTYVYDAEGNKTGVMAMGRDITSLKQAEEKLEQSELFYKSLIKDSLDGMLLTNLSSVITFASPSIKNILGYDVEDVLGKNCFEFVHPDDLEWAVTSFQKEVNNNPDIKSISVRILRKNGSWLWCMVRGHNLLSNPYVGSVVLYIHDDTLRKNAKDALVQSEKLFRGLISELQVGVLMHDAEANVTLCNKTATRILGVSEEEIMGRKVFEFLYDVIHENGRKYEVEEFAVPTAVQTRQSVRNKVMGFWSPAANQRTWIWVNAEPILDKDGKIQYVICSFSDITERKQLEQKLISDEVHHQRQLTQASIDGQEQERKEIGKELHDNIGQQLTTTKLYLDLAKASADDETNELISLALKSISDVINEIRSISHSLVPPSLGDLGLEESLRELTSSVRRTQLLKINLDFFELDEDSIADNKKLMIYRIVQEQLNNIVKHANASEVYINIINDEKHYLIEVKDNGNGFDLSKVKKGLGLTNIRNRAELFGGKVTVATAPGKGCSLKVIIPHEEKSVMA